MKVILKVVSTFKVDISEYLAYFVFIYADLTQKLKVDPEYVVTHWREVAI